MPYVMTSTRLKKILTAALLVLGAAAVTALPTAAAGAARTWSVAAHYQYENGFEFDYVFATGVPTEDLPAMLEACGRSHSTGSVVRYHCFPIPE